MEEAPESYKDVTDVVNTCHAAGISQKCIKLRPIGVIKGWKNLFFPSMKICDFEHFFSIPSTYQIWNYYTFETECMHLKRVINYEVQKIKDFVVVVTNGYLLEKRR